jgi:protein-tyrosine phosphatase
MTLKNFSWVIDKKLAGSDAPGNAMFSGEQTIVSDIGYLYDAGVRALVSLTYMPRNLALLCKKQEIAWSEFVIADYGVPSNIGAFNQMIQGCIYDINNGIPVCTHCQAGVGRTGMVLACVVGVLFSLSCVDAVSYIKRRRPAIETEEQLVFIKEYLEKYTVKMD